MKSFEILQKVLLKIKLSNKELKRMTSGIKKFVLALETRIKRKKIKAEVFVGGSSGKGTVVKRKKQDIDVFVRFIGKDKEISGLLENILKNFRYKKIHGSRDYFKVYFKGFNFEVVPVLKIKKPQEAKNVTDLSYFHVSYVNRKMKQKDLRDDIILAKSFCYANRCYGAESYIKGFSGYALELLVIYYKSFENMIKKISKVDIKKKLVVDLEKHYKGNVMDEMNESKLISPIIFIDPTFKERNVLSALSYNTFLKFKEYCKKFLKKPEEKFFFKQPVNKKNYNLMLTARTLKQEGDIAGSKLWKFYNLLKEGLDKNFIIKKTEFRYDDKKKADLYFKIKARKEIIFVGPPIIDIKNVSKFRKKHKKCFIRQRRVYAKEKPLAVREFLSEFKADNKNRMGEMGIVSLR